jgi:hypothetical protein
MNILKGICNGAKNLLTNGVKAIFGGSDDPHVQTNFSSSQETVMNILNQSLTTIETSMSSDSKAENNTGAVTMVATNGSRITVDISQDANVQAAQIYNSMISMIMNSDADTDVKLDALGAICQAVKNDGNIAQSPETVAANVRIENNNTTNLTNIQKLNQNLKLAISTCAVNNFEGGTFLADKDSEINFKLKQKADTISHDLIDMVTDETSTLDPKTKQEFKEQIEMDNKAEGTGVIAGLGKEAGKTVRNISDNVKDTVEKVSDDASNAFKFTTGMMIAAVAVPVVLVILVIIFVVVYKMINSNNNNKRSKRSRSRRNRRYEDDDDYDDYDDYDE